MENWVILYLSPLVFIWGFLLVTRVHVQRTKRRLTKDNLDTLSVIATFSVVPLANCLVAVILIILTVVALFQIIIEEMFSEL